MEDNRLEIKIAEKPAASRKVCQQRGVPWMLLMLGMLIFLVVAAGLFLFLRDDQQDPSAERKVQVADRSGIASIAEGPENEEQAIVDDGESLWGSPTDGAPIECSYLLPGTQLILHVRVADLLAHGEGEKVLAALGPWGQAIVGQLTSATGARLEEIDTLLLGIRTTQSGELEYSMRLNLNQPFEPARLRRGCFLSDKGGQRLLVRCSVDALAELAEQATEPPLFARELQRVLSRTDASRTATLVFAGKFLQISGEKFLVAAGERLQTALLDFLGEDATATALSAHWDENFFVELQSTVALNQRPHRFAELLEQRVVASSDTIEDRVLAVPLHPYARKVLARFPAMIRKLSNYTRSGEQEGLSVLRSYLPVRAGHNLIMAAELLLNEVGLGKAGLGKAASSRQLAAEAADAKTSLSDRLQQTSSLVFPKETLQRALEMFSEDLGLPIEIAGRDLQLAGITKNQSFAIELRNRPGVEILLAVLLRANPDQTVSGPSEVNQKLVYVVREPTDGQPGAIVVTTRAAAQRRGDKLPAVFVPASR